MALLIPDANVLIHALRQGTPDHPACRRWLVNAAAKADTIALVEMVEVALLRIPTLPRLQLVPVREVLDFWKDDLWNYPGIRRIGAGDRHREILSGFIEDLDLAGNDINDAWLAALAIEQHATLVSTDNGFARFRGLDWLDPRRG